MFHVPRGGGSYKGTHDSWPSHTVNTTSPTMRKAVLILSVVAAVVAEAPYHLPRPPLNAPGINYQQGGLQYQQQQNYNQNSGYQYQQPNIGPSFVQPLPGFVNQQVNQQYVQRPNVVYGSPLLRQPFPVGQTQQSGYINGYPSQQGFGFNQGFGQNGYTQPIGQSPLVYNAPHSSYSSYQADNNAYANSIHREPLDATVVGRLENILKENEHSSARDAGFISLVSGVSLERARPSVELSSFVHNSPLRIQQGPSLQELARGRSIQAPSAGYGLPNVIANSGSASQGQTAANFGQQNQVSSSYGTPN